MKKGKIYLSILAFVLSVATAFAVHSTAANDVYKKEVATYILTGCSLSGTLPCTPPTTGTCKCFYVFVNGMYVLLADNTPLYVRP